MNTTPPRAHAFCVVCCLLTIALCALTGCPDEERQTNNIKNNVQVNNANNTNNTNNINNTNNTNNTNNLNNTSGRSSWSNYVESAARAVCVKRFTCCDESTREAVHDESNVTLAQCVHHEAKRFEQTLAKYQRLIDKSRVSVEPDALFQCLSTYEALSCEAYAMAPELNCDSALEPQRELNQSCEIDAECKTGFCALFSGGRTCQPASSKRNTGDLCEESAQCKDGLYCNQSDTCAAKVVLNAPCEEDAQCGSGSCVNKQCAMPASTMCLGQGEDVSLKQDDPILAKWRALLKSASGTYCDKQGQCCDAKPTYISLDKTINDSCQEVTEATLINQLYALYDAQKLNRIDPDDTVYETCKQAMLNQTCDALESADVSQRGPLALLALTPECAPLFKGAAMVGARCLDARECATGTCFRARDNQRIGRCAQDATQGESCAGKPCDQGLYCIPNVSQCTPKQPELNSCDTPGVDLGCAKGFSCQSGVGKCEALIANGMTCSRNEACQSQRCNPSTSQCVAKANNSESCMLDTDCLDGWCDATGVCRAKKAEATTCINNQECASGTCNGTCYVVKPNQSSCSDHFECQSGYCDFSQNTCQPRQAVGQACTIYQGCQSDRCDGGLCIAKLPEGQSCQRDRDCEGYCKNGMCKRVGAAMDTCSQDGECGTGLLCIDALCRAPVGLSQDCFDDRQCQQGACQITPRCLAKPVNDTVCTNDAHCASGYCSAVTRLCEDIPAKVICR